MTCQLLTTEAIVPGTEGDLLPGVFISESRCLLPIRLHLHKISLELDLMKKYTL